MLFEESPGENCVRTSIAFDVVGVHLREEVNECFEFVGLRKKHKEVIEICEGWTETTFQESL